MARETKAAVSKGEMLQVYWITVAMLGGSLAQPDYSRGNSQATPD